MNIEIMIIILVFSFYILNAIDWILTKNGLENKNAKEINPIINWFIRHYGMKGAEVFQLISGIYISLGLLMLLFLVPERHFELLLTLVLLNSIFLGVVYNNIHQSYMVGEF